MDSSRNNSSFGQWNSPYSPPPASLLPPPPPLPPHHSNPQSPSFYVRPSQSGSHRQDYHRHSRFQDCPPTVNQQSSYYSQHASQPQHRKLGQSFVPSGAASSTVRVGISGSSQLTQRQSQFQHQLQPRPQPEQRPQSQAPRPKMTPADVQKYTKVFVQLDTDRDGKITGHQARDLFLSWRLPREALKQVWDLSDQDNDSMLSLREFCIAVYLMERYREGWPLPSVFPSTMISSESMFTAPGQSVAPLGSPSWRHPHGFQQQQQLHGVSRPPAISKGKPLRPVPHSSSDEMAQPTQPKRKMPELEKHLVDQLSKKKQDSLNSKFEEATAVDKKDLESKKSLSSRYEIEKRKRKSNYSTQKSHPRSMPSLPDTKKDANPSTHITKRHTWHRKSVTSPSPFVAAKTLSSTLSSTLSTQQKFPKLTTQSSSSYIRKGNILLRNPSYGSPDVALGMPAIQWNRFIVEDKSTASTSIVDVDNASFLVKTEDLLTLEKQSRPPSNSSTSKVSNAIATSSGKCALSYSMDHLTTGLPESIMDSATSGEANVPHSVGDTSKKFNTLIQSGYASDCQQKSNLRKLDSPISKRMVYVKRKANQLVAASDNHGAVKSQILPSDGYFKRSKNQLVRNSENCVNQSISLPDDTLDSRAAANMILERSSSSAFSDSAVMRPFKKSKFSLVWTQNDPQPRMPIAHMRYQKILPQLVPWKRMTYWRRLMNSVSVSRNGSFSNISRKLSIMRKRHTVYTRSTNGYSLRKSKVLSIGGSHLKWSKSIERDSRKANEEATLAVAAFTKKENEKQFGQTNDRTTCRNHLARERVFRFGSVRYKMDSSRRTLQRISDVDSPCSGPSGNGTGARRPFIPKRLVIGNEEYVRVGNGNQLVRDPKKRTRVLANEKVRWSLHNVRLRLAKKKKYCQFFTRFGKCNKDDGKCPYVHDSSKIAVCTKFLNGLCANDKCKLTHKVIPERMPDCSYFLQGLCNNETCPYRHVHVNPNAAICDGFLKGYCSDGNECRKKHSYTCPDFEATGSCSQGSKCKLHHPKNQSKGRKRKRLSEPSQKNARGRYFGSLHKDLSESEPKVVNRRSTDSEVFGMEGLDFIILSDTECEAGDNNDPATEQSISGDSEAPVSINILIRPVALMQ